MLYSYANLVESFWEKTSKLNNDAQTRDLLGQDFGGADTDLSLFQDTLQIADEMLKFDGAVRVSLLGVILEGQLSELKNLTGLLCESETKILEQLTALGDKTGLDLTALRSETDSFEFAENFQAAAQDKTGLLSHSRYNAAVADLETTEFAFLSRYIDYAYRMILISSSCLKRSSVACWQKRFIPNTQRS